LDREGVVEREGIPREAVGEWDEALHAKEIYIRLRDERCICLVELIDAKRKKTVRGKGWQLVGRTSIRETHHCTFIAAVCTLNPASVPIIPTTFDTVALAAVATISATLSKLWWLWRCDWESPADTPTPCICAETPSRTGREVTRRLRADMRRVKTRALEALLLSPSVAKAS
jgi:hypothetical protein